MCQRALGLGGSHVLGDEDMLAVLADDSGSVGLEEFRCVMQHEGHGFLDTLGT